jgi:hypothetical protein
MYCIDIIIYLGYRVHPSILIAAEKHAERCLSQTRLNLTGWDGCARTDMKEGQMSGVLEDGRRSECL